MFFLFFLSQHYSKWNFSFSSRAETVRSALDVLAICCVIEKVALVFCERMELPDEHTAAGINFILGASEGEIVTDAEVQKSALAVLVHCVCAPISIVSKQFIFFFFVGLKSTFQLINVLNRPH